MVLVLCGAGKDRSGGRVAVHQSAKGAGSTEKELLAGPSGRGAGTAEVIERSSLKTT